MSQHVPQDDTRRTGDREYLWFALLLIAVLATSVSLSYPLRHSASNVEASASDP